ncbi:MAG: hypothetical protein QM817_29610 [Archangium sp.]
MRADRREFAVLGLAVLAWGLLLAPLIHRDVHAHGVAHSHGPAKQQLPESHGVGSLEHQDVALGSAPVVAAPVVVVAALELPVEEQPCAPWVAPQRRVELSQAP